MENASIKINLYKMNIKNDNKGFTLIELLMVIVIIGILSGVVFIALQGQGKRTRLAAATTTMKNMMSVGTACLSLDGEVSNPGTDIQKPANPLPICSGVSQFSESVWLKLPEECLYCGKSGSAVYYQCSTAACGDISEQSSCDFMSGQCVQTN
jgi:prepilin-type N-terminal cleavage/methylation domain-containing protein